MRACARDKRLLWPQSKAKEFNAHEEELRQQTEERKEHEHR